MKDISVNAGALPLDIEQPTSPAASAPRVPGGRRPYYMECVAREKLGAGDDWKICAWERVGPHDKPAQGVIVQGGIPRVLTRGKYKGRDSWRHIKRQDLDKTIVTAAEMDAAEARYETSTGNCGNCGGSGQQWAGWNHIKGNRWRECTNCGGSGAANAPESPVAERDGGEASSRSTP